MYTSLIRTFSSPPPSPFLFSSPLSPSSFPLLFPSSSSYPLPPLPSSSSSPLSPPPLLFLLPPFLLPLLFLLPPYSLFLPLLCSSSPFPPPPSSSSPLPLLPSLPPTSLNLNLQNNNREAALWLALKQLDPAYLTCEDISQFDHTFAARLIKRGATPDATDARTGNSLLHNAALNCNEAAAVFLVHHGAVPNIKNIQGEAPIHIAAKHGLHRLVEVLLQYGADPNLQTALKPKPKAKSPTPIPIQSPSYAAATRLDDITSAILSPSTLGALSALNATSQVTSEYTFDGNVSVGGPVAGYSSQAPYIFASGVQMQATPSEGETQFRMSPWPQRSGSSLLGRSGGGGSTLTAPRQTGSPIFKKGECMSTYTTYTTYMQ